MNILLRLVVIVLPVVFLSGCEIPGLSSPKKGQDLDNYSRGSTDADGEEGKEEDEKGEESSTAKVAKRTRAKRVSEKKEETALVPEQTEEKLATHKQETKKPSALQRLRNAFTWRKKDA
jgi:hypothetical protein